MIVFRWLLPFLLIATAHGAVTLTESTQVTLLRGTTTSGTYASWDACLAAARTAARASTATTGAVTYTCQTERRRVVATYSANPPPPSPVLVNASLTWTAVTEEVNGSAATNVTYAVEQSPSWTRIATLPGLSYQVTGVPQGTCLRVRAISSTGEGAPSNQVCKS